ncbi:hypothetical protein D4764_19G0000770 [Takifugu flavidus]|uniref:Uncharacterized protein n=1 Tax=Takifugu flavidus TaxID=433684 RepID=A0A5C6NNN3_9TELE|nr:hypothetical protein D4764_19G0000770 [Takifugu flavidus]
MAGWVEREERRGEEKEKERRRRGEERRGEAQSTGTHTKIHYLCKTPAEWKKKNYTRISMTSLLDEERRGEETMTQWGDRGLPGDHVSGPRQP